MEERHSISILRARRGRMEVTEEHQSEPAIENDNDGGEQPNGDQTARRQSKYDDAGLRTPIRRHESQLRNAELMETGGTGATYSN